MNDIFATLGSVVFYDCEYEALGPVEYERQVALALALTCWHNGCETIGSGELRVISTGWTDCFTYPCFGIRFRDELWAEVVLSGLEG